MVNYSLFFRNGGEKISIMEKLVEKAVGRIFELSIGATQEEGGTRGRVVKVGGQNVLPFLRFEGDMPNQPAIAMEVWDTPPEEEWPWFCQTFKDIVSDAISWVKFCESQEPDLICLRLVSTHPDKKNTSAGDAAKLVKEVLSATSLPLIVIGSGHIEKDCEVLPEVCEVCKGEKILIGMATKDNYRTIVAAAISGGHSVIAETPLDINLAKQLNILISDAGLPLERIVMHHTTGGLGYGFEYCYSIMERCRIAALQQGDKVMSTPIINMVAEETWKVKEAKSSVEENPTWGELNSRGPMWELITASAYLQAGSDILVVAHPHSVKYLRKIISSLME